MEVDTIGSTSVKSEDNVNDLCNCIVCNLLKNGFDAFSFEEKKLIIAKGRPTPALPNLTKQDKSFLRHFSPQNYKRCEWLTGCNTKSVLFCWSCLLFSNENNQWNKSGFSNLPNLQKMMKNHSYTKAHLRAILQQKSFGTRKIALAPDNQLRVDHEKHNQEVKKNREILKRLIDVLCFLNDHDQSHPGDSINYTNLCNLLAKYDQTLKSHLEHYSLLESASGAIQSDLLASMAEVTLRTIKSEIDEASFVAIMLDVVDNRLAKTVRYVRRKGEIKERFLGFVNVITDRTAPVLYTIVQAVVDELNCGSKLVAQSYNGATVIPGELGELQTIVKEMYPGALFVHSMAHRFHLVLQQSLDSIKECKAFFSTLTSLASFFLKSPKRTKVFDVEIHKKSPIRWNYDAKLAQTVLKCRLPLMSFFENVLQVPEEWDPETVVCSRGYLDLLRNDVNFNFLLLIFSEVFAPCDALCAALQSPMPKINSCVNKIAEFKSLISTKREQFHLLWDEFKAMEVQIEQQKRKKRALSVEDEETRRRLFLEIIDNITTHIDARFGDLSSLIFIKLTKFCSNNKVPEAALESLKRNYPDYFDFAALRSELTVIYDPPVDINRGSLSDLWKSIVECGLKRVFPETFKLCELTLTIPVTNPSTESNFFALERIQNFLANSTGHEKLPSLALLSVERELVREISCREQFYDDVIEEFSERNTTIPLNFK